MVIDSKHRSLLIACSVLVGLASSKIAADEPSKKLETPEPLQTGAVVVPLWPVDKLVVKGDAGPESLTRTPGNPERVANVTNIHNPSIEVHLAPPEKRTGTAIILIPGGGNRSVVVGTEGTDVATWLNELGVSAFILRYRIRPYDSAVEGHADTQRAVRTVRARAGEWGVDPVKIGVMGFSAGGEQAARVALDFDRGQPEEADAIDHASCRPDFVVMVYAGWAKLDMSQVPADAPPTFLTSAGLDDAFHAKQTVEFYNALFDAKIPVELHIYGHGGHAGGIGSRGGIPFGTWQERFVEWARDLGMMSL
ncbi:MAG TPA: alpha/beta hydrolase [Lacipirellulaceae bacterium]|jgi:endo-1,4-beta-xylanase